MEKDMHPKRKERRGCFLPPFVQKFLLDLTGLRPDTPSKSDSDGPEMHGERNLEQFWFWVFVVI